MKQFMPTEMWNFAPASESSEYWVTIVALGESDGTNLYVVGKVGRPRAVM